MKTKGIGIIAVSLSVLTAAASMTMMAGCGSKEASTEATTVSTTVASTTVSSTNSTAAPAVTAVPVQNGSQGSTQSTQGQNTTVANPDTVYAGIGKQAAVDKALATQGSSYQVVSVEQGEHNGSQAWVVNLSNGGAGRDMVCYVSSNFCIPEYNGDPVVVDDPNEDNDYDNDYNSDYDDDDEDLEFDNVNVNDNEDENEQ